MKTIGSPDTPTQPRPEMPAAGPDRAHAAAGAPKRTVQRREARIGFYFALPAFLLFIAFRFGPAIAGVALSFFDYDISGTLDWQGVSNFQHMVGDPVFWQAMRVTLLYSILEVPLTLTASVLMALAVRRGFRGSRFFRSLFFLPVITSLVLAGSIFKWIFSSDGPWSTLMTPFGLGGSWLNSPILVIPVIVIIGVWSRFGYGMLIVIAALQDVPRELEEAALMDGAGAWPRFRYIVLPHLKPVLYFLIVIETAGSFQVFDLVYVLTQGGPARGSYSLVYMLYDQGFRYSNFGYGAAIGVMLFLMTLAAALIQRRAMGRDK